jgi:Protein of unknown function (DUF1441)
MPVNEKTHARRAAMQAAAEAQGFSGPAEMALAKGQSIQAASAMDAAGESMLYDGVNMAQMARLFGMNTDTVKQRIHGIAPAGVRRGVPIWRIRDIYPTMWKPTEKQVDDAMQRLNHADLPKALTKEYWAGRRSRQEYELKAGDLWPTIEVVQKVGELLKLVRMSALLMVDTVARQTELTDRQRAIIKESTDGMLLDLHEAIAKNFKTPEPKAEEAPVEPIDHAPHQDQTEEDDEL